MVVVPIRQAAPAEGRPLAVAFAGVVVDDIQQHLDVGVVAGSHQLAHVATQLQWIISAGVAVVGCEPVQGAVPPDVVPPWGGIGRIKGEHRQQLDCCDAEAFR